MTSSPENKITRSDLVKSAVNVGALGMEFSWTYYKQMNIAFCLMAVSYTHLDVYKRQAYKVTKKQWDAGFYEDEANDELLAGSGRCV